MEPSIQEAFDTAVNGIIEQGKPAYDPELDRCVYRYKDLKCAVGMLIPDEKYTPQMDASIYDGGLSLDKVFDAIGIMSHKTRSMLGELQTAHDDYAGEFTFMEDFLIEAKKIGRKYGLNVENIIA